MTDTVFCFLKACYVVLGQDDKLPKGSFCARSCTEHIKAQFSGLIYVTIRQISST